MPLLNRDILAKLKESQFVPNAELKIVILVQTAWSLENLDDAHYVIQVSSVFFVTLMLYLILNTDQLVLVMVGYVNMIHLEDPKRVRIIVLLRATFYVDALRHCLAAHECS